MSKKPQTKTPEQLAAQIDFINSANESQLREIESVWSVDTLKKLSKDQIIERLFLVTNQSLLIKWRLFWELRKRFKKSKEFKQQLCELRGDPTYAYCVDKQQHVNRALHAGKFCERHRITDLNKAGVYPTAIYELSKPINADVADDIYKEIKGKNIPVYEVSKKIADAQSSLHNRMIRRDEVLQLDVSDPVPPYVVPVINNIAIIDGQVINDNQESAANSELIESSAALTASMPVATLVDDEDYDDYTEYSLSALQSVSDEQMAMDILKFCEPYQRNFMRLNGVLKLAMQINTDAGYKK